MIKTTLKIIISLALTGIFLWAAFHNVDWPTLQRAFQTATPLYLLFVVIILIASCLPRAWRWQMLLAPVAPQVTLRSAFWAVLMAYAGNSVIPRSGEVARALAIRRDHPAPLSGILATVVVERLLDMLTLLIIFGFVLIFAREQIGAAFPGLEKIAFITLPFILITFVILGLLSFYGESGLAIFHRILMRLSPNIATRATDLLRSFLQGMGAIHSVEAYVGILVSTILLNACYLLALYVPLYSFDLPQNYNLGIFEALVVMTIATVGVIIPTPGGTGTYHFFCMQTLHLFYGVPKPLALAFATSVHGVTILAFCLFGGPPLIRLLWQKKKDTQDVD